MMGKRLPQPPVQPNSLQAEDKLHAHYLRNGAQFYITRPNATSGLPNSNPSTKSALDFLQIQRFVVLFLSRRPGAALSSRPIRTRLSLPSGEKVTELTESEWPSSVCSAVFQSTCIFGFLWIQGGICSSNNLRILLPPS
jgi:hypothetical protein